MTYFRGIAGEPTSVFDTGDEDDHLVTEGGGPNVFDEYAKKVAKGEGRPDVKKIQQALKAVPIDPGPIDGIWGPKTCGAMLNFQEKLWGNKKQGYLDAETFIKLGFDPTQATFLERDYGAVCGGALPSSPAIEGQPTPGAIKAIQAALQIYPTGVFDKTTCARLYEIQHKTGNYGPILVPSTFSSLGFTRSTAVQYAQWFAMSCGPFHDGKVVPQPDPNKPKPDPNKPDPVGPDIPIVPVPDPLEPKKAGFSPWIVVILGGGLLVTAMLSRFAKKPRG